MTDEQKTWALIAFAAVLAPVVTVAAVKLGDPRAVWFYCTMLGWCG